MAILGVFGSMVFEHIEKLKSEYTDRYVVIDAARPELRRFDGMTGQVRTVNMSGRALVEFPAYNNISWYDIAIDFLRVVEKPADDAPAKAEKPAKAAAKPAEKPAAKEPSALEKARAGGDKAKPAASKMSVADMLAAARGDKGGAAPAAKAPAKEAPAEKPAAKTDPKKMSVADMLAAARGEKGGAAPAKTDAPAAAKPAAKSDAAPAKADPKKMSVADMLAAARGETSAEPAATPEPAVEEPAAEEPVAEEPAAAEPAAAEPAAEAPAEAAGITPRDQLPTEVDEIVAFCRRVDAE